MRGLLIKDLCLIANKRNLFCALIILGWVIFIKDPTFSIPFTALFGGIVSAGTILSDESNKSFDYLLTMPVTVKDYIKEKFIFCLATSYVFLIAGGLLNYILGYGSLVSIAKFTGIAVLLASLFVAITITADIKLGLEKSRYIYIVIYAIGLACLPAGKQLLQNKTAASALTKFASLPDCVFVIVGTVLVASIVTALYAYSIKAMKEKYR